MDAEVDRELLDLRLGVFRGAARPDPAQVTALVDEHPHLGVECVLRDGWIRQAEADAGERDDRLTTSPDSGKTFTRFFPPPDTPAEWRIG